MERYHVDLKLLSESADTDMQIIYVKKPLRNTASLCLFYRTALYTVQRGFDGIVKGTSVLNVISSNPIECKIVKVQVLSLLE